MSDATGETASGLGVLDRYLTIWIGLAMALGIGLGSVYPGVADLLNAVTVNGTSLPIAVGLFVMILPIMAEIDYGRIPRVTRTARREIALTLTFNWLVAPFVMYGLAVSFLGGPLLLGYLLQCVSFRTAGRETYYDRVVPRLSPLGLLGLLFTVVVMFALKGEYIVANPETIALIAVPLLIFFGMWALAYGAAALLSFDYAESISVAFTSSSNNFELAIAVAVAVFGIGSDVALATVVGPLIEVPVMLALVRVALATRHRIFPDSAGIGDPTYSD